MVPKLHPSMGWTLNFANLQSYIVLAVLLGIVVVFAVML